MPKELGVWALICHVVGRKQKLKTPIPVSAFQRFAQGPPVPGQRSRGLLCSSQAISIRANPAKAGGAKLRILASSATVLPTKDSKIAELPKGSAAVCVLGVWRTEGGNVLNLRFMANDTLTTSEAVEAMNQAGKEGQN